MEEKPSLLKEAKALRIARERAAQLVFSPAVAQGLFGQDPVVSEHNAKNPTSPLSADMPCQFCPHAQWVKADYFLGSHTEGQGTWRVHRVTETEQDSLLCRCPMRSETVYSESLAQGKSQVNTCATFKLLMAEVIAEEKADAKM